ncbi:uncharacterized protein LOC111605133 [Drosophila hydei]|uniref:Uncharacterized protein LOC111605133 n=1 Tax=Drosophila hydei TaxID=7224 RepID=A0A6J2SUN2_DROHY|nr:uncharacterized protein LOC111605133 [Drosophila hydei]XP_023179272.2 uncharacterized protein LOC111605133 [Drosophila hydei]XP_023179274.2 uncharacterized protein LOC111605133 [Drosophila hydei]XP_023179275.2 uncharacterized protein LOC111605133 [Drosophila hydei]XP_023179276.2 uncharacterized protein LOC111605133 [Drosophila hydei]XP_030079604.1 uncharacterized protein LOC111605133 [Drosophila hydei]
MDRPRPKLIRYFVVCIALIFWLDHSVLAKKGRTARQFWVEPNKDLGGVSSPVGLDPVLSYLSIRTGLDCPLCDSSVYSYCSHKVEHDVCCCGFPGHQLHPSHCAIYNCSVLYAKSCYEHALIMNCCCGNPY